MNDFGALLGQGGMAPWLYLPLALGLGALHALEPGHGKTMMAGFIVAIRGTPGQAVLLGVSAAVAHSLVVWTIVLTGLWLGRDLLPEALMPWLGLASGLVALGVAGWMARGVLRQRGHGHDHHHGHDHDHHHDHAAPVAPGNGQIIAFGFSGGLVPCPSALVVLALCLHAGAFGLGIATVTAFSLGLALVLVGVGVAAAFGARRARAGWPWLERVAARAPWLSVAVIALTGVYAIGLAVSHLTFP
ncbi:nickel/cobalt exporter [Humitalea rosea]|uniref:Nickel/cobalt efflux system n=1 Tax=Humitalea rosea TaxID=990373 RepID=A0A2W7IRV3_9PROT|nr:sulfite exporter TauE/SafE family protein [Humitalea rosea]PZW41373.1 nickel/cobalt exporter [Humitalea rosea]